MLVFHGRFAMKAIYFGVFLALFGICNFCGDEFMVVGRHEWRCRSKNIEENVSTTSSQASRVNEFIPRRHDDNDICDTGDIECACGRKCKGLRGIKRHQRSCRVIKGLSENLSRALQETAQAHKEAETEVTLQDTPSFKPGIKLPKSDQAWSTANDFFKANHPISDINNEKLDNTVRKFNDVVYNYMAESHGTVNNAGPVNEQLSEKCAGKDMKRNLCFI